MKTENKVKLQEEAKERIGKLKEEATERMQNLKKKYRKNLEKEFMKFPEIEMPGFEGTTEALEALWPSNRAGFEEEPIPDRQREITKRMNDINTFQECSGELCLRGTDEFGEDFTVWFDTHDFLEWINTDQIKYIKENLIKHIRKNY